MGNTQDLACCHSCMSHFILPVILSSVSSLCQILPQIMTFTASSQSLPVSLLTCRSLSWLCLSRMRTRSCSSSTVPWRRSFSSIMALRRCSSSRFLSVSILICRAKRGPVRLCRDQRREAPHSKERNETAKSRRMYTDVLYLCERNYLCVCFKAQESFERKQLLPQTAGAAPKGLGVHWQVREQARIFKDIK